MDVFEAALHKTAAPRLTELLDACRDGVGQVVTVSGPAGVGRSRLMDQAGRMAESLGVPHLAARGSRSESDLALWLLLQLFQQAPLGQDAAGRVCELVRQATASSGTGADGRLPEQVVDGLVGILGELAAGGPLLLVVDDVQHADTPSLRCLHALGQRVRALPVLLLLGRRDGFTSAHSPQQRAFAKLPGHRHIRLALLTRDQTAGCLAEALGPREGHELAANFHALTGGNPLLAAALLRDRTHGTPRAGRPPADAFRQAVLDLLGRLPDLALPVAKALAVLERRAEAEEISHALGVPAAPIAQLLGVLGDVGLLGDGYFRHPCTRNYVLGLTDPEERATMLRRAAAGRRMGAYVPAPKRLLRAAPDRAGADRAGSGSQGAGRKTAERSGTDHARAGLPGHKDAPARGTQQPALSEAERRVAELAAGGLTNKEIAERLFITVSTVEQHLTRVYRKLVVARRAQLVEVMGGSPSPDRPAA